MSHGPAGEGSKAEPNLTPLLDVVLQLLMFFMMCANFVTEQTNQNIKLPVATSARPMEKTDTDLLILNLNKEGELEILGKPKVAEPAAMKYYLQENYDDFKRASMLKTGNETVNTAVVIRADKGTDYWRVHQLMQFCKDVGFNKLQIRAYANKAPQAANPS